MFTLGQDGEMWYMLALVENFRQDQCIINFQATKWVLRMCRIRIRFTIALCHIVYRYSGTPLNDHPDIPNTFKSPAQLLLIDISINTFQNYYHPEITAIFFGPMGGRISEVPLYCNWAEYSTICSGKMLSV